MKWLIVLIVIALAFWHFTKKPEPVPIEETFMADQAAALQKAEDMEDDYLKSVEEQQKKMEEQIGDGSGGD